MVRVDQERRVSLRERHLRKPIVYGLLAIAILGTALALLSSCGVVPAPIIHSPQYIPPTFLPTPHTSPL